MDKQQVQNVMATHGATIVPHLFSFLSAAPDKTATALRNLDDETLLVTVWMITPDDFLIEACMHEEAWWFRGNYRETNEVLVQLGTHPDDQSIWDHLTHVVELAIEDQEWIKETVNEAIRRGNGDWRD
jgi:hypothetical protein